MAHQDGELWSFTEGDVPVITTAIHDGHELRSDVRKRIKLNDADRLREEDPYTGHLVSVAETHIVPHRSRFEVDLNRARETAVYRSPEDCWGIDLWEETPTEEFIESSLAYHDTFYKEMDRVFTRMARNFGAFVVLDVHSYNHRRLGPDAPPEDPTDNPEVNIGTTTMDRGRWAPVVDRFMHDLAVFELDGRRLDVRENIKFFGRGNLARHTHGAYRDSGCVLAIEFRKSFMDEWSGEIYEEHLDYLRAALESTLAGVTEEIIEIGSRNQSGSC